MQWIPPRPSFDPGRHARGFTMVELLVSMAVLVLMMSMLAQIFITTTQATRTSRQHIEGIRQARSVLDTLRSDLSSVVVQNNAATVFISETPNPTDSTVTNTQLVLVTQRRGPLAKTAPRFMSIAYSLDQTQLKRRYNTVYWNKANLMTEAFSAHASDASVDLIDGVIRMEATLLLDNDKMVPLTATGTWITQTFNNDAVPENFSALVPASLPADPANPKVRALIMTVAALDANSLRLPNASGIAAALTTPPNDKTAFEVWSGLLDQGGLSSYPRPAVAALRVLQQTFLLQ